VYVTFDYAVIIMQVMMQVIKYRRDFRFRLPPNLRIINNFIIISNSSI